MGGTGNGKERNERASGMVVKGDLWVLGWVWVEIGKSTVDYEVLVRELQKEGGSRSGVGS